MLFVKTPGSPSLPPREYLEQVWLPRLGARPPVLDIGVKFYTAHYRRLVVTPDYITVDKESTQYPDVVADIYDPSFKSLVTARYPLYRSVLFNGMIGFGVFTPKELAVVMKTLLEIMESGGQMLIGWNEPNLSRKDLFRVMNEVGFDNLPIEGLAVCEPPKNPSRHFYTHWRKP